jgi:hypothetical protein
VHLIAVAKKGEWICPYCDEDIGDIEVERTKEDGD